MRISSIATLALVGCALGAPPQAHFKGPGAQVLSPTPTGLPAPSGSAPPSPPHPGPPGTDESSLPIPTYEARAPPPPPSGIEVGEDLPTPSGSPVPTGFPAGGVPPAVRSPKVRVVAAKSQFGGIPAFDGEDGEGQAPPPAPTPSDPGFPPGAEGFPSGAPPVPSGTPSGVPFQA
ncbi:hypothetical protein BDW66DRAFT_148949 [Aspergillus desertorum]